eukprot:CAMPEP_0194523234 /NCGR_PEP_ID=MMETSP0253-20130528/58082_1 /TAXON_ID=2966 /ORGANISM="Noctiluca scintillans" /LENGTH=119 /DNA_ID=CAMNT_0039367757 /DNA_START=76 /DNA_END=435 /DNA_ORIENTATION=+
MTIRGSNPVVGRSISARGPGSSWSSDDAHSNRDSTSSAGSFMLVGSTLHWSMSSCGSTLSETSSRSLREHTTGTRRSVGFRFLRMADSSSEATRLCDNAVRSVSTSRSCMQMPSCEEGS